MVCTRGLSQKPGHHIFAEQRASSPGMDRQQTAVRPKAGSFYPTFGTPNAQRQLVSDMLGSFVT
jgi:hypothetical protein